MFTKVYEKNKKNILDCIKILIFFVIIFFLSFFKLPYYIDTPGGVINVFDKIDVESPNTGSINMPYVSELKATIPIFLYAKINDKWDIIERKEVVASNESENDSNLRSKLMLKEANNSAVIYSYNKANKNISVTYNGVYVTYIYGDIANTDLKVGDKIIAIDNVNIKSKNDIYEYIKSKNINDKINIKVINDNEIFNRYAYIVNYENKKLIGILISDDVDYKIDDNIIFNFAENESGPSGGLAMTLGIYSYLTNTDITKGKKIVATGTIDINGNVGTIGGVKYKLLGAVKNESDIFIVPNDTNYKEAIKYKNKYNLDIEIIGVDTFDDALNYLQNIN